MGLVNPPKQQKKSDGSWEYDGPGQPGEMVSIDSPFVDPAINERLALSRYGRERAGQIPGEMENATGNEDEFNLYKDEAVSGIDSSWHDAGRATAESFARRGLNGSGMAIAEQQQLAGKRNTAVDDAILKARTQAIARQRSDLASENAMLVGLQTSDVNAQRLAMEQQAYYDRILAEAVGALGEVGGTYAANAMKKKQEQEDALAAARARGGSLV